MIEYRYSALDAGAGGGNLAGVAMRPGERASIDGKFVEEFRPGTFAPLGDVVLNWSET